MNVDKIFIIIIIIIMLNNKILLDSQKKKKNLFNFFLFCSKIKINLFKLNMPI